MQYMKKVRKKVEFNCRILSLSKPSAASTYSLMHDFHRLLDLVSKFKIFQTKKLFCFLLCDLRGVYNVSESLTVNYVDRL